MQYFDILKELDEVSKNPHTGYRFRFVDAFLNAFDDKEEITKEQIIEVIGEICDDLHNAAYFFDSLTEDIEKAESEEEMIGFLLEEPNL